MLLLNPPVLFSLSAIITSIAALVWSFRRRP
jgi:hypothetical protein